MKSSASLHIIPEHPPRQCTHRNKSASPCMMEPVGFPLCCLHASPTQKAQSILIQPESSEDPAVSIPEAELPQPKMEISSLGESLVKRGGVLPSGSFLLGKS